MDLPAGEQRQNWPQWMTHEVRAAEWVLVIASREYKRRAEGEAGPAEGRGVQWEALQIQERIYVDQHTGLRKVVPVVLPGQSPADIPVWLAPSSTMYYVVSEFTVAGAEKLLRLLTGQAYETESPLGPLPVLPPRGAADAVSAAPAPSVPSGAAQPGKSGVTLPALAQLSSLLADMAPSLSWTPGRWNRESAKLRLHLAALDRHLDGLPDECGSLVSDMRQAIRFNATATRIIELTKNITMSLACLHDSTASPEARTRDFEVFTKSSAELRRSILQLQDIVQPPDPR